MEKEEILEKIKKENQDGDERQQQLYTKSYANGFFAINLFCITYYIMNWIIGNENDKTHFYIMGPFMVGNFVYFLSEFFYFRKKTSLIWVIVFGLGTIAFLYFIITEIFILNSWFA